jgi:hypothetical protein
MVEPIAQTNRNSPATTRTAPPINARTSQIDPPLPLEDVEIVPTPIALNTALIAGKPSFETYPTGPPLCNARNAPMDMGNPMTRQTAAARSLR